MLENQLKKSQSHVASPLLPRLRYKSLGLGISGKLLG